MKALLQSKRAPSTRGHSKTSGDGKCKFYEFIRLVPYYLYSDG